MLETLAVLDTFLLLLILVRLGPHRGRHNRSDEGSDS
jgi:hypothetical protein